MQPRLDSKVSILKISTEKKIIVSQHEGQSRQFSKVCLDTKDNLDLDWSRLSRPPGLLIHMSRHALDQVFNEKTFYCFYSQKKQVLSFVVQDVNSEKLCCLSNEK
jgi:hypothetical protein